MTSSPRSWRRGARGPAAYWWFIQAFVTALAAPALVRLPLPLLDRLGRFLARRRHPAIEPIELARLVDAAIARGTPLIRRRCTTRAITLWLLLRRDGVPADLRFGVGNVDGSWEGHSWVTTVEGPLAEASEPEPTFTCVATLSG